MVEELPDKVLSFQPPTSSCRIAFGIDLNGKLNCREEKNADFAQKFLLYSLAKAHLENELEAMQSNLMQGLKRSA